MAQRFALGALAAQTTLGGGFGFLASGTFILIQMTLSLTHLQGYEDSSEKLNLELSIARKVLQAAEQEPLQIGVSFLVWQLEKDPSMGAELLSIAISQYVQAIWVSFGEDLGHWIRFIRSRDRNAPNEKAVKIFVQISTVEQAIQAVNEWKADVIVVQGPQMNL